MQQSLQVERNRGLDPDSGEGAGSEEVSLQPGVGCEAGRLPGLLYYWCLSTCPKLLRVIWIVFQMKRSEN